MAPQTFDLLAIPSYEKLVMIADIEQHHTQEMFDTSQLANPYAADVRREFLERDPVNRLQTELEL